MRDGQPAHLETCNRRSYGEIVLGDPAAVPPDDPYDQLRAAIGAVFASWYNNRVPPTGPGTGLARAVVPR